MPKDMPKDMPKAELVEEPPPEYSDENPDAVPVDFEEQAAGNVIDIKKQWPAFLEALMRDRPNIGTFLSLAIIVGSTESSIDLCYPQKMKFQFGEMTKKQNREEIIKALTEFLGRLFEVHITLSTPEKAGDQGPAAGNQHTQSNIPILDNEIEREPIIQAVLDLFDGEIIR